MDVPSPGILPQGSPPYTTPLAMFTEFKLDTIFLFPDFSFPSKKDGYVSCLAIHQNFIRTLPKQWFYLVKTET